MKLKWLWAIALVIAFARGSKTGRLKDSSVPDEPRHMTEEREIADFEAEAENDDAHQLEDDKANDYVLKKSPWWFARRRVNIHNSGSGNTYHIYIRHSRRRHG